MKGSIIEQYYNSKEVDNAIHRCNGDEDTKQMLFEILLKEDEQKILQLHQNNEMMYYITRVLVNLRNSANRQKKNFCSIENIQIVDEQEDEILFKAKLQKAEKKLIELKEKSLSGYYISEVFTKFVSIGDVSKVARHYNISRKSVYKVIDHIKLIMND